MDYLFDMPTDFKVYKIKRDKSSGSQPAHTHPYYEIFYLINGDCTFFIDHNIYKLNRGDLIIVPQGELHKSSFPQHGISERYVLCFKESNLKWLNDIVGPDFVKESLSTGVISIPDKRDYVEALMNKMIFENEGQDILSPAFIRTGLIELVLFIIRCRRYEENVIKELDVDNQLMQQIATYIYENYDKKLNDSETLTVKKEQI